MNNRALLHGVILATSLPVVTSAALATAQFASARNVRNYQALMVDIALGALITLPLYLLVGIVASVTAKRVPWLGAVVALGLPLVWIGKLWTLEFFSAGRHYIALYLVSFPLLIYPTVASLGVWAYMAYRTRRMSGPASGDGPERPKTTAGRFGAGSSAQT